MGRGRPQLAKELSYFERAKQRLRNKDAYNDMLKCLSMYTQEIISRQELLQLLNDIIGRFPDLMVRPGRTWRTGGGMAQHAAVNGLGPEARPGGQLEGEGYALQRGRGGSMPRAGGWRSFGWRLGRKRTGMRAGSWGCQDIRRPRHLNQLYVCSGLRAAVRVP